ncbi:MAG TPA: hypothetical protein VFD00_01260 [Thermoclostridium sp.]|nr:hypothetical protein [Thermoclostridium sp.]
MMNGKLDERAPTLPEDAAERLIKNINKFQGCSLKQPVYINNDNGEILPW